MSLYHELKRRNVFRVAVAYLALAWLLIEVAGTLFPGFGIPAWAFRFVVIMLVLGFVPTLIFSWAYEITPEGVKREKDVVREASITHFTAKRLDGITIGLIVFAVAFVLVDRLWLEKIDTTAPATETVEKTAPSGINPPEATAPENSIAVLAFANMSSDKDQEYFADGLSDTLIHVLAQVSGLKVTAKTSSFSFKGKNIDVGEIARELNVSTILEGSVQKAGNRVRVIAQLINADDGTHLWSKSFDRDLEDIFVIQDDIAQEVVMALKVTLLDTEEERLEQRYQPTLEAYEQLILGRHEMAKRTAVGLAAAEQHFKQAIELDPDYALAYVGLADNYALQSLYAGLTKEESLERRQPLIEKALELDPLSAEAYTSRALFQTARLEFEAAEEGYIKAIELNPSYATAPHWYSTLLLALGRFEEAQAQTRVAAELDPMSPMIQVTVAMSVWNMGRAEEALTLLRHNIDRNPEMHANYYHMANYQSVLGHLGVAQRWQQEVRKRNPGGPLWRNECLGFLHLGDTLSAEDCVNQLSEVHPENLAPFYVWHHLHVYRGEWNAAISTLEYMLERQPKRSDETWRLADLITRQGDVELARRLMADAFPELLEDGLELSVTNLQVALTFAAILHANNETQRRDVLLLAMEERIATMHRNRGYGYGISDVYIHAMRGDRDQAIASLREAIDIGWLVSGLYNRDACWWMLRQDWKLGSLRQDPEFIVMMDELEADIAGQRQWYEENKDKPLF